MFFPATLSSSSIFKSLSSSFQSVLSQSHENLQHLAFTKEIKIRGLKHVSEQDVRESLPLEKSIFWWWLNPGRVVSDLLANNYVADVKIQPCSGWLLSDWGCFSLRVIERKPTYLAVIDDQGWLVGEEGAFMFPVEHLSIESPSDTTTANVLNYDISQYRQEYGDLKVISGISRKNSSPELVSARFDYTVKAIKNIERVSGLKIDAARLLPNGELLTQISEPSIRARFNFAKDDWDVLKEESERLATLLKEYKGNEKEIAEIDLAYQRLAVVKVVPEVTVDESLPDK